MERNIWYCCFRVGVILVLVVGATDVGRRRRKWRLLHNRNVLYNIVTALYYC
jgi:hypothetical protein